MTNKYHSKNNKIKPEGCNSEFSSSKISLFPSPTQAPASPFSYHSTEINLFFKLLTIDVHCCGENGSTYGQDPQLTLIYLTM